MRIRAKRRETSRNKKEKAKERKVKRKYSRVLAGRRGGGKFNFDPVDSAVIPKFNL